MNAALPGLRASLALVACAAVVQGCGPGAGNDDGAARLRVHYVIPPGPHPDPFDGLISYRVTIRRADGTGVVVSADFDAGESMILPSLEPVDAVVLELEGFDGSPARISHGRTVAFDLEEADADVSLYFARANTFNDVNGSWAARIAPAAMRLSDGRVVIAGGIAAGQPVGATDLYDPDTDALTASVPLPQPRGFPVAAALAPDVLLLAGGTTPAGAPSAAADLFVWDAADQSASWPAIPAMNTARRDAAGAPLGSSSAILVSGSGSTGLLASSEIFEWDGTAGSWTNGPNAGKARKGGVAFPAGDGRAILVGGWSDDDGGKAERESRLYAVTTTGATFGGLPGGGLLDDRAWAAAIEIATSEWLLVGGIEGEDGSSPVTAKTERLLWNGTGASHVDNGDAPTPRRRGAGARLEDGLVLLIGGDLSDDPHSSTPASLDEALLYSPSTHTFSPAGASPGAAACGAVVPLADGTALVVSDDRVTRYNPP